MGNLNEIAVVALLAGEIAEAWPGTPPAERTNVPKHEAGHAIAALRLGIAFDYITTESEPRALGHGLYRIAIRVSAPEFHADVERLLGDSNSDLDRAMVLTVFGHSDEGDVRAELRRLFWRAHELVRDNLDPINALAEELARRKTLTGLEARALLTALDAKPAPKEKAGGRE